MVEEGLNCLPSYARNVTTPTGKDVISWLYYYYVCYKHVLGCEYEGQWFEKNNCAVSILRSGKCWVTFTV